MEKIKLLELFSGIQSQEKALKAIKVPYESVGVCELDKECLVSAAAMRFNLEKEIEKYDFPNKDTMVLELQHKNIGWDFKKNCHTITNKTNLDKVKLYYICDKLLKNIGDISLVKQLPYADLVTYSSPCFVPGTMVLTSKGFKNIEDVVEGDMVLTHTNQYQKVMMTMKNYCDSFIYEINAMCSDSICATSEHPFYVRKRYREWNNNKRQYDRKFMQPEWIKSKDLTKDYYVGTAINQNSIIPKWDRLNFVWTNSNRTKHSNKLDKYMDNKDFWWVIGRYLGDGWLNKGYGSNPSYGIKICCAQKETLEITTVLDRLNINYCVVKERTVCKVQISMKEIYEFCLQFGSGAANKRLTNTILDLPIELLQGFLDGYMSADGNCKDGNYQATSVSRELIYGLTQCVAKIYHRPSSVNKFIRPKTCIIEGRTVNQKDTYTIRYHIDTRKQDHAFYENGYIWSPISRISQENYNGYVYNMEVENDNSYTVQNIIVHNCQSFSVAGKLAGAVKTCKVCGHKWDIDFSNPNYNYKCPNCGNTILESTTSGLLQEVQRLLSVAYENNKLPKYLLLENVKNLTGKKFINQFNDWIKWLDSIGYNTYWKVLNAKQYGIPQNRERVFAVSIRKDIDNGSFQFPEPIPLNSRLKDILETNVPEKYYLPDERVQKIIDRLNELYPEPICVASRGRNPDNPSDRTTGAPTEQRLEPNMNGCINTLTSVSKDNWIAEPQMLRAERTDYGKKIRKQYESGEVYEHIGNMREMTPRTDGISNTVTTVSKDTYIAEPQLVGGIGDKNFGKQYRQGNRVYDSNAIAMALTAQPLGNTGGQSYLYAVSEPVVYDDYNSKIPQEQDICTTLTTNCGAHAERNGVKILEPVIIEDFYQNREARIYEQEAPTLRSERTGLKVAENVEFPCSTRGNQIASTLRASMCKQGARNLEENVVNGRGYEGVIEEVSIKLKWRIRKLMEKECFRLMGFTDEDYERAAQYTASSHLYKQCGNSICTCCLVGIFYSLLYEDSSTNWQKYLVDFNDKTKD